MTLRYEGDRFYDDREDLPTFYDRCVRIRTPQDEIEELKAEVRERDRIIAENLLEAVALFASLRAPK